MITDGPFSPYLLIQWWRLGLRPEYVRIARETLDLPWEEVRDRAARLLRSRYAAEGGDAFEWLSSRPVNSKEDVRRALGTLSRADRAGLEKRRTSGSSGSPILFYRDREMSAWMEATALALYSWHGQRPWVRQARFWGRPLRGLDRPAQRLKDRVLGRRRLGAFSLSDDRCRRFFHSMRRFRPSHAYGYPSVLADFASRCAGMGLDGHDLGFQVVIVTGELLVPSVRTVLMEFFGCRVVNEYGCTESGILAFECEAREMHLTPVASWIETLDQGTGEPVFDRPGVVVLTDLMGSTGPFLRYELGDRLSVRSEHGCSCGRDLPKVSVDGGRIGSSIVLPGGKKVYGAVLAYAVPSAVRRFRGRQTSESTLEVEVELNPEADGPQAVEAYQRSLVDALGSEIRVIVRVVPEIPPEPSGKHRYFIPLVREDGLGRP